jgi:hypothetical protein
MMKLKLLIVVTSIFPMVLCAQTNIPTGIDGNKYSYCMSEMLNTGRPYELSQRYCQRWAAPANLNQDNPIYSIPANDLISQFSDHHLNEKSQPEWSIGK